MNLIKNASFESGELTPWVLDLGDPDEYVITNDAILLRIGMKIQQVIDVREIGNATRLALKADARASPTPPSPSDQSDDTRQTQCDFRLEIWYQSGNTLRPASHLFYASGGWQHFGGEFTLELPEPLVYFRMSCWIPPGLSGPGFDKRDIWFKKFELTTVD